MSGKSLVAKLGKSKTLEILGPEWFAEVKAARVPGKVIWCNFDLARELGFDVPPVNQMTAEFHEQLLDALCYKALQPREESDARRAIILYADKYGGDGVVPALGASRAGFTPYGNLCVKGIGFTPLFKHDDPDDFVHSHGCLPMREAILDTVFGELNSNLFTKGTTRTLAIIDLEEYLIDPKGKKIPRVLVARAGRQLRPGHFMARWIKRESHLAAFARVTRDSHQISLHRSSKIAAKPLIDMRATMLRIIHDHAVTAAEQFRWRLLHGAITPSNMQMGGAMIDLATGSSQPRTAPIYVLDYVEPRYGTEHLGRARALQAVYRSIRSKIPRSKRRLLNAQPINFIEEMKKSYANHLQVQFLKAAGLKSALARRIKADHPGLARRFMGLLTRMAQLRNPGSVYIGKSPVEDVSVLDVFRLLQKYPLRFFDRPSADHKSYIRGCLRPVYKGNASQRAGKRLAVNGLVAEFQELYRELMKACEPYSKQYYGDPATMKESIKARAAFENEPIVMFYRHRLNRDIPGSIAKYRSTGDTRAFIEVIDCRVSLSVRNVEALLFNRPWRQLAGGVFETQIEIIDRMTYSVIAWNNPKQRRRLRVCFSVEKAAEHFASPLAGIVKLTTRQIQSLRYRYTTDDWKTSGDAGARLRGDEKGRFLIESEIGCAYPSVGRLEGGFYLKGLGRPPSGRRQLFQPYNYVIPDREELKTIAEGAARPRSDDQKPFVAIDKLKP